MTDRYPLVLNGTTIQELQSGDILIGPAVPIETSIVTATAQTAVKNYRYILTNVAATTVVLPAAPILGDTIYIVVANDLLNNIVDRNGLKIMGLEENLTIDYDTIGKFPSFLSFGLVYINSTLGWRLI